MDNEYLFIQITTRRFTEMFISKCYLLFVQYNVIWT